MPIRPYLPGDRADVDALLESRCVADGRPALSEHKAIRVGDLLSASTQLVLVEGGRLVGYVHAADHPAPAPGAPERSEIEVVVAPEGDEGDRVATLVEAMVEALPTQRLRTVWAWRPVDVEAVTRLGLVELRRLHEMCRPLPVRRTWTVPDGIAIRPFRPNEDEEAWLAVNNAAFAGHPENGALDRGNLATRMALPWFDPEGFLMAWEGPWLRGSCWTKRHDDGRGEIYIVAVAPEAQGRGLGTALALAGLHDLAERQRASDALLYVDGDDEPAVRFYQALGFEIAITVRELAAS